MFELWQGRERGGDVLDGRIFILSAVFFENICHRSVFYTLERGWFGRAEVAEENRTNTRCVSVLRWPLDGFSEHPCSCSRAASLGQF